MLCAGALSLRTGLKIGDLDEGAPELRRDSRYNLDNAYVTRHYGLSSDQFAVIVKTPKSACDRYEGLVEADRLGWELEHVEGVKAVTSFAEQTRRVVAATSEGYFKWNTIARDPSTLGPRRQPRDPGQPRRDEPELLGVPGRRVPGRPPRRHAGPRAEGRRRASPARTAGPTLQFLPAAGTAGIEAVTNIVVH